MAVKSIAIGTAFGRLTVLGEGEPILLKNGWKRGMSRVRCECGAERVVLNGNLNSGLTRSCGCSIGEQHGKTGSHEYMVWKAMKTRCANQNVQNYARYGGRGIQVCDRWLNSFSAFLEDMGTRPSSDHSIDRVNNNGNYEPGNCVWATMKEQQNNKRSNVLFTFYGKTMTLTQWCRIAQIKTITVRERLKRGWSEKEAFWTPVRSKRKVG